MRLCRLPFWHARGPTERAAAVCFVRRRAPAAVRSRLACYGATGLPIVVNLVVLDTDLASRLRLLLEPSWSAWGRFDACVEMWRRLLDMLVSYSTLASQICDLAFGRVVWSALP